MSTIVVQFKEDARVENITIETNKTVENLLFKYLEKINRAEEFQLFHFLINGHPLEKEDYSKQKIKNCKFIKNMCQVKVRRTEKNGGYYI